MPIWDDEPQVQGPRLDARASIAVELDWALSAAHRAGQANHPRLTELYRDDDVRQAVLSLWKPSEQLSYPGYLELSAVAQPAGLLFSTDPDEFLGRLEEMCADAPTDLALLSETPADRELLLERLRTLRRSPARRRHYVEVATMVWSSLREAWERQGRPAVEAEVAAARAELEKRPDWTAFVAGHCGPHRPPSAIIESFTGGGEVVVVPAWFARKGLWIDLHDLLIIGVGVGGAAERSAAEDLARQLKALSDTTRLTILRGLTRSPMTVTEIAQRYSLAQPTVSNHIKLLKEAGFVRLRGDGRSRVITVDQEAVRAATRRLGELLGDQ